MATTDHTVHLKPETFQALEAEAERRRVAPDELADELVREQLPRPKREPGYLDNALDRLDELSKTMPEIDPVEVIRQGRDELEERALRWQSS